MQNGVTRLYFYHDSPYRTRLAWPNGDTQNQWTEGAEAEKLYANADYICVSCLSRVRDYWGVHTKGSDERFEVDYLSHNEHNYANLAKKLEEHSGRTGLVILVC